MTTNAVKLFSVVAWAVAAISAATPAAATAATKSGAGYEYAACSVNSTGFLTVQCSNPFNYKQQIKFVWAPCNLGGCAQELATTLTTLVYPAGRKTAVEAGTCISSGYYFYEIGTCAC
jgi:hypothetical protein